MDTALLTALIAGAGGVIAYLLRENSRLRRENWQNFQALYENSEAMKYYAAMRKQGGRPYETTTLLTALDGARPGQWMAHRALRNERHRLLFSKDHRHI